MGKGLVLLHCPTKVSRAEEISQKRGLEGLPLKSLCPVEVRPREVPVEKETLSTKKERATGRRRAEGGERGTKRRCRMATYEQNV